MNAFNLEGMIRVLEVYDLSLDLEAQLEEPRALHLTEYTIPRIFWDTPRDRGYTCE